MATFANIKLFLKAQHIWMERVTSHNVPSFFRKIHQISTEKMNFLDNRQSNSLNSKILSLSIQLLEKIVGFEVGTVMSGVGSIGWACVGTDQQIKQSFVSF